MPDDIHEGSEVTIMVEGRTETLPFRDWIAFLGALEQPEVESYFTRGGTEVQAAYRKLVSLSPTTAG